MKQIYRALLFVLFACCMNVPIAACAHPTQFAIATAPYTFHFPRDHAAHDAYRTEWWYYTGHLIASDGRPFGFELTFFRVGLAPGDPPRKPGTSRWRGNELYPAHFAISDIAGRRFFFDQRLAREALDRGGSSQRQLAVHADDWAVHMRPDGAIVLHATSGAHALDLTLVSEKSPAIHGTGGITKKGACRSCASHYYSLTRMRAVGSLSVDGRSLNVHGQAWMDHEFGSSQLESTQVGWDWFSFQFNDRREVMYYQMRTATHGVSPQSSGSLVDREGAVRRLTQRDVHCQVLNTWTSSVTHAVYPSTWQCRIPRAHLDFIVKPRLLDQELAYTTVGSPAYWEGDVALLDAAQHEIGTGYVELTGYAAPIHL